MGKIGQGAPEEGPHGLRIGVPEGFQKHVWSGHDFARTGFMCESEHLDGFVNGNGPIVHPRQYMGVDVDKIGEC